MGWWEDKVQDTIAAVTRGVAVAKLGPGVLGTIVPIVMVGFAAIAILGYALSAHPIAAVIVVVFGLAFLVYALERAFRYAEKNPLSALLSGTEIFHLIKHQTAARDEAIVIDAPPVVGIPAELASPEINGGDHA